MVRYDRDSIIDEIKDPPNSTSMKRASIIINKDLQPLTLFFTRAVLTKKKINFYFDFHHILEVSLKNNHSDIFSVAKAYGIEIEDLNQKKGEWF